MKCLVIEDDTNKRQQLVDLIEGLGATYETHQERSYQSGLRAALASSYDLIFLDMTMPTFDRSPTESGGRIRPFAGRDILDQLKHRNISAYVVMFTQFGLLGEGSEQISLKDLHESLKISFPNHYKGYIFYDIAETGWRERVIQEVAHRAAEL